MKDEGELVIQKSKIANQNSQKMFFSKLITKIFLLASLVLVSAGFTLAQTSSNPLAEIIPCEDGKCNQSWEVAKLPNANFKETFLPTVTRLLVYTMVVVATLVFSAAGAIYVFSWGEQGTTKKAKYILVWGVTGLAFAAAAFLLVRGALGINFGGNASGTSTTFSSATTSEVWVCE